jgi:hypothetical protein
MIFGLPVAFAKIDTVPGPPLTAYVFATARFPVVGSTAQSMGYSPVSLRVAIGLEPPWAYSNSCDVAAFEIQTFPFLSLQSPSGWLKPVRVCLSLPCG